MLDVRSFIDVVRANPRLGTYVERIDLFHDYPNSADSATASFPAALKGLLPRLKTVSMSGLNAETTTKATSLPLHPHFPSWLASFRTVTTFTLYSVIFASFGEFLRIVNAFPLLRMLELGWGVGWHARMSSTIRANCPVSLLSLSLEIVLFEERPLDVDNTATNDDRG